MARERPQRVLMASPSTRDSRRTRAAGMLKAEAQVDFIKKQNKKRKASGWDGSDDDLAEAPPLENIGSFKVVSNRIPVWGSGTMINA